MGVSNFPKKAETKKDPKKETNKQKKNR